MQAGSERAHRVYCAAANSCDISSKLVEPERQSTQVFAPKQLVRFVEWVFHRGP
jgi:hypothetical protein